MIRNLDKILRIIIIILLISIAILSVIYKYDNCNVCKFKINNTNYDANEFMNLYSNTCLKIESEYKPINLSLKFPLLSQG